MPPSPSLGVVAGRGMAAAMACLALAWWVSLALDAFQGRTSWWPVVFAACALLAWAVPVLRWSKALAPQAERRIHWHPPAARQAARQDAPVRWTDEEGRSLTVSIAMDLGAGVLVRVLPADASRRRAGQVQWRWIGHRALRGPWRWRLVSASGLGAVPADERGAEQTMVASWALASSQKATLPKPVRRSA